MWMRWTMDDGEWNEWYGLCTEGNEMKYEQLSWYCNISLFEFDDFTNGLKLNLKLFFFFVFTQYVQLVGIQQMHQTEHIISIKYSTFLQISLYLPNNTSGLCSNRWCDNIWRYVSSWWHVGFLRWYFVRLTDIFITVLDTKFLVY